MTNDRNRSLDMLSKALGMEKEGKVDPPDLLEPFSRAISIALQLPVAAFEQITNRPTTIYK